MVKLPAGRPPDARPPDARETKIRFLTKLTFPDVGDPLSALSIRRRRASGHVSLREIEADRYLKKLRELSDSELDIQYQKTVEALQAEADRQEAARPFNQPYARADFSRWAKMAYWTCDEAVALSLGCEPKFATWETVQSLVSSSRFASRFAAQREIAVQAKTMGQLRDKMEPALVLAWAERIQFAMPDHLVDAVKSVGTPAPDWKRLFEQSQSQVQALTARLQEMEREKPPPESPPLDPRERESLLKLVIGMAIQGYSYDPKAKRSSIIGEIVSDLLLTGMSLSEDTVRRHLANGKELLPGDETE